MTAPKTSNPAITLATRADILRRFYRDGQNTCEIGKALDLPEAVVAEVVRLERERRVAVYAGRAES